MNFKKLIEKVKYFLFVDLDKFTWYIFTEPFRKALEGLNIIRHRLSVIKRIQSWMIIFATLAILTLLAGNILAAKAFTICFLIVLFHYEWKRGFFRKRWKDKEKKRYKKILEKKKKYEEVEKYEPK